MKRNNENEIKEKKKLLKLNNFYLVEEFIWMTIQDFCDLETFLNFFKICKKSYQSIPYKEEYFKQKIIEKYRINFKLFHNSGHKYHADLNHLPYLKLTFFLKKYQIDPNFSYEDEIDDGDDFVFPSIQRYSMVYSRKKLSFWRYYFDEDYSPTTIVSTFNWKSFKWDVTKAYYPLEQQEEKYVEINFLNYAYFAGELENVSHQEMKDFFQKRINEKLMENKHKQLAISDKFYDEVNIAQDALYSSDFIYEKLVHSIYSIQNPFKLDYVWLDIDPSHITFPKNLVEFSTNLDYDNFTGCFNDRSKKTLNNDWSSNNKI